MGLRQVTLGDIFRRNAQLFPDRTNIVYGFERISHRDYLKRAERLAAGLAAQGVKSGDRVAVAARNCLEFADLYAATALIGVIMLPINWRLSADEMAYVLADGAPALVIVGPEDQPTIAGMQEKLPASAKYFGIGSAAAPFRPFAELTTAGPSPPAVEVDPDQGYVIIHTAAVDGRPRGALISQSGLIAASMQLVSAWQLDERDIALVAVPLFHVTGLGQMLTSQLSGGSSVIMTKFDPAECARTIEAEKATTFAEFVPMLMNLLDKAAETGTSLSSLRAILGLDTAETIGRFEKTCPDARFWAAYGQSETSGLVTLARWRERPGSAGQPTPLNAIAVVDELDQPVATGQVGEIVVRGPMVFCGYWRREHDNKVTFRNGWHHTGDMGRFDGEGYLFYTGRSPAKELIKPGGENVYPAEVEKVIREHAAIAEVSVIGVSDPQWGEAVKAVCVCRPGKSVVASDLAEFVASKLARYKKPKHVVFVDALPKTAAGVIDRAAVKLVHGGL
jgi:acyl-CoA synthetase (AMP-forming)/AMP-acid ligase II